MEPEELQKILSQLEMEVGKTIVGHKGIIRKVLLAFLSGGHVLLQENLLKAFGFHQSFIPNVASLDIPKESLAFRRDHPVVSARVTECC